MGVLEIIFWIGLFIVFYTYIGYGMLLYALVKLKECFRKTAAPPDRKSTRLNSSHASKSRMPSSA